MTYSDTDLIELGYVIGPHGLQGECAVQIHNPNSQALTKLSRLILHTKSKSKQTLHIEWIRPLAKGLGIGFREITNRDEAKALKGASVMAIRSELDPLSDDEFYLEDIRDYDVVTSSGREIGRIVGFMYTNVDILVVQSPNLEEVLIPVLADTVVEIDHVAKQVSVQVPDGLLDL